MFEGDLRTHHTPCHRLVTGMDGGTTDSHQARSGGSGAAGSCAVSRAAFDDTGVRQFLGEAVLRREPVGVAPGVASSAVGNRLFITVIQDWPW